MITIYEAEKLLGLIRVKNQNKEIIANSYSYKNGKQRGYKKPNKKYKGNTNDLFDIIPRLICRKHNKKAYESHLQMFLTQNIAVHESLNNALGIDEKSEIEWIGNEVSCGVGMQRIDVMFSHKKNDMEREVVPIELKARRASADNIKQVSRYIDWIEQYYVPNRPSIIRPVLICPHSILDASTKKEFRNFNRAAKGRYLPLEYIEVTDNGDDLIFTKTKY